MKTNLNASTNPNLFNLLTLRHVIAKDTLVYDEDAGCEVSLWDLLEAAAKEVEG